MWQVAACPAWWYYPSTWIGGGGGAKKTANMQQQEWSMKRMTISYSATNCTKLLFLEKCNSRLVRQSFTFRRTWIFSTALARMGSILSPKSRFFKIFSNIILLLKRKCSELSLLVRFFDEIFACIYYLIHALYMSYPSPPWFGQFRNTKIPYKQLVQ